jgi:4-amino-4-deoxy-L-arabinose transferase-like glycosyltransferase
MPRCNYISSATLLFICAITLRVLLFWSNPPGNVFDNHYEPIFMIMNSGKIPAKDACWQCYHPPVFYWISAKVGNLAAAMGLQFMHVLKVLQFMPCLYGILTVGIIYLILRKLPLSDFSRLIAFGTICFLPRHIYMSAINSNDTISYLFVALSVYLLMIAIERKLSPFILSAASAVITITLFTKYTAYVVLPIVLIVFAVLFYQRLIAPRKKILASFVLVTFLPIVFLSGYWMSNMKQYGSPLPWNVQERDPGLDQPHDDPRLDFFSFKPWESINTPIIVPGRMHSFWTLIHSGMWFDNEPKFLTFMDSNPDWWKRYYGWINGRGSYPGDASPMSNLTRATGSGLIMLGLVPLLFIMYGFYVFCQNNWKSRSAWEETDTATMNIFPTLLISNAVIMIALALRLQVYSAMKAAYFLNSMPAFAVFLSLGLMPFEKNTKVKWAVVMVFSALFALVSLHILHVFFSSTDTA